ncbi:hypothetical protein D3C75_1273270 [compost metagenome]
MAVIVLLVFSKLSFASASIVTVVPAWVVAVSSMISATGVTAISSEAVLVPPRLPSLTVTSMVGTLPFQSATGVKV